MAVCNFFLQGTCRFGTRCHNEHPVGGRSGSAGSSAFGAGSGSFGNNSRTFGAGAAAAPRFGQPFGSAGGNSACGKPFGSNSTGSAFGGGSGSSFGVTGFGNPSSTGRSTAFGQGTTGSAFGTLAAARSTNPNRRTVAEALQAVPKDLTGPEAPTWPFTCYGPDELGLLISGTDMQFEEIRWMFYEDLRTTGNVAASTQKVNDMLRAVKQKVQEVASNPAAAYQRAQGSAAGASSAFGAGKMVPSFGSGAANAPASAFGGAAGGAFGGAPSIGTVPAASGFGFVNGSAFGGASSAFGGAVATGSAFRPGTVAGTTNQAASVFAPNSASSVFGQSGFGNAPAQTAFPAVNQPGAATAQSAFASGAPAASAFGQPAQRGFGSQPVPPNPIPTTQPPGAGAVDVNLHPAVIAAFQAPRFEYGKVPGFAPPPQFV
ncbi:hypothetical protein BDZ88DRAFT_2054 [Geranomyces variabilis]|nr:hypothetical protein BDZ88DRAFT_2054 [Geranomyces variabilis]KAJ3142824.1 hypothetical protein HDU90_002695 [Geranomyces variabilis]